MRVQSDFDSRTLTFVSGIYVNGVERKGVCEVDTDTGEVVEPYLDEDGKPVAYVHANPPLYWGESATMQYSDGSIGDMRLKADTREWSPEIWEAHDQLFPDGPPKNLINYHGVAAFRYVADEVQVSWK